MCGWVLVLGYLFMWSVFHSCLHCVWVQRTCVLHSAYYTADSMGISVLGIEFVCQLPWFPMTAEYVCVCEATIPLIHCCVVSFPDLMSEWKGSGEFHFVSIWHCSCEYHQFFLSGSFALVCFCWLWYHLVCAQYTVSHSQVPDQRFYLAAFLWKSQNIELV